MQKITSQVFITGTDTDVGKTVISKGILLSAKQQGLRSVGFKPISAGCELTSEGLRNEDALILQANSSMQLGYDLINPIAYQAAIAPHIAAQHRGESIDMAVITDTYRQLTALQPELLLIEGAGGWHLPVNDEYYLSDWVKQHNIPVIMVVGMKLGCLNHAVLTANAIVAAGVQLVGWVANCTTAEVANYSDMIVTLKRLLPGELLAEVPYCDSVEKEDFNQYFDLTSFLKI